MPSPVQIWRKAKSLHTYLGKTGKIITWSRIYIAPPRFEHQAPYFVAIVEVKYGQRAVFQVVDYEENHLQVGQKVEMVIRRLGKCEPCDLIEYGIKVRPIK